MRDYNNRGRICFDACANDGHQNGEPDKLINQSVLLGPRPYFRIDDMDESKLKHELQQCAEGPEKPEDFHSVFPYFHQFI